MIVKVQLSIEPLGRVLIYNETRTIVVEIDEPATVESIQRMIGGVPKAYCKARYDKTTKAVHLLRTVKPQPW